MSNVAWELTHTVETEASLSVAWKYWTNVESWNDPPAEFELDGPFATGSLGTTRLPGQQPLHWIIREIREPKTATIEMQLEGATLSFEWQFEGLADGRTRLTQRVVLRGENDGAFVAQAESAFTSGLPDGMNKIAAAMAHSGASRENAS